MRKFKVLLLTVLAFTLATNIGPVYGENSANEPKVVGQDKTALIKNGNLSFELSQGGVKIDPEGNIDISKPIAIDFDISVPVKGDFIAQGVEDPDPSLYIQKGDYAVIPISKDFILESDSEFKLISPAGITLGTVHVLTENGVTTAYLHFDGDETVYDGTQHNVFAEFYIELNYGGDDDFDLNGEREVIIIDKDFTLTRPKDIKDFDIKKTGLINNKTGQITWTVDLEGTLTTPFKQEPLDFKDFVFSDDLSNAGKYVPGSFQVNDEKRDVIYTDVDGKQTLEYTMPEGSISKQTITYVTELTDEEYYGNDVITKTNDATIKENEDSFKKTNASQNYNPQWIKKTGDASYKGGDYDPANQTITWKVTINETGATLDNVVLTDILDEQLSYLSSKAYELNADGTPGKEITMKVDSVNGKYEIGNITGPVVVEIVTKINNKDFEFGASNISNTANVTWNNQVGEGGYNGTGNVGIGYTPISKSGAANTDNQTITWTTTVDKRGQTFPEDLTVYDLIIHGWAVPNMKTPEGISEKAFAEIKKTNAVNQKYIPNSFNSEDLNLKDVIKVYDQEDNHVADLLVIDNYKGNKSTFTFDTYVTNPNITIGNSTHPLNNRAFLFSSDDRLNSADAVVNYTNNMIAKKVVDRDAHKDIPNASAANEINKGKGYNYLDNSVVYRLDINIDGIDVSNVKDHLDRPRGVVTVTDTLPAGWDFINLTDKEYLIYEYKEGKAVGEPLEIADLTYEVEKSTEEDPAKITFTFEQLDKAYVILVKATPSEELLTKYFGQKVATIVENTLNLKTENWDEGTTVKEDVQIQGDALDKTAKRVENGVAEWSLTYNPYSNVNGFTGEMVLVDTLPEGIELQRDDNGVIIEGSIKLFEYVLNIDGTLTEVGEVLDYTVPADAYNLDTRELSLVIPDAKKAYRFTYLTDIVGEPGEIKNNVKLEGGSMSSVQDDAIFVINREDSAATMERLGSFAVSKVTDAKTPLAGVEFTLFAADGVTVLRKGVSNDLGIVNIRGLVSGKYILKETQSVGDYVSGGLVYNVEVIVKGQDVQTIVNGEVLDGALEVVNYLNNTRGGVQFTKSISGNGASPSKEFNFTVDFKLPEGVTQTDFEYTNDRDNIVRVVQNGGTVSIKANETIKFVNIPKETVYTFTEENYTEEGYEEVKPMSGVITADKIEQFTVENIKHNKVVMKKVDVDGNIINDPALQNEFEFALYKHVKDHAVDVAHEDDCYEIVEKYAAVNLDKGYVTLSDLPEGKYKIVETKSASDYVLNTVAVEFELKAETDGVILDVEDLVLTNYQGSVELLKTAEKVVDGDTVNVTLANAKFNIYKYDSALSPEEDGELVAENLVTDDKGLLTYVGLAPGEYYFREIESAEGNLVYDVKVRFEIKKSSAGVPEVVTVTHTNAKATAELQKQDDSNNPLAGAEFTLNRIDENGDLVDTLVAVSQADGVVRFEQLIPGNYVIVETKSADGYILNEEEVFFSIPKSSDQANYVHKIDTVFKNYRGSINLRKVNELGAGLAGVEFELTKVGDNDFKQTHTSSNDGVLSILGLAPGTYNLVETKSVDGNLVNDMVFTFDIKESELGAPAVIELGELKNYKGMVKFNKVDEFGGLLANVNFNLKVKEGNGFVHHSSVVSDANGLVTIDNLTPGTYQVSEAAALDGYIHNTHTFEFVIPETFTGEKYIETLANYVNYQGKVELSKTGEDNSALEGVKFDLYDAENNIVHKDLVTDEFGVVAVDKLAPGSYYFLETQSVDGNIVNTTKVPFTIVDKAENVPALVEVSHKNAKAKVEFNKVGENQTLLADVEFELYLITEAGEKLVDTVVSDVNGLVSSDQLIPGNYEFRETKAKDGYILNTDVIKFTVSNSAETDKLVITLDDYVNYQGKVKLVKEDENQKPLEGVVFDLYTAADELVEADITTDAKGEIFRDKLVPGKYYFIETSSVDGNLVNDIKVEFEIEESHSSAPIVQEVKLTNYKAKVEFTKVNEFEETLEGVTFNLYKVEANAEVLVETVKSDETGLVSVDGLTPGEYVFREDKTIDGYILNLEEIRFTVEDTHTGEKLVVTLDDYVNYQGKVELSKVDEFDQPLADVEFNLYDANDKLVSEGLVSNEQGIVAVDKLAPGSYYFVEVKSAGGNIVNDEPIHFEIVEEFESTPEVVLVSHKNAKAKVVFNKVDEDDNFLAEAKFELYFVDTDGNRILKDASVSSEEGLVEFDQLSPGNYVIVEVESTEGYVLNLDEIEFEVPEVATTEKLVIELEAFVNYQGKINIEKVDVNNKLLDGATFELYNESDEIITTFEAVNGKHSIDKLAPGTYYIVEKVAPKGYQLDESKHVFEITEKYAGELETETISIVNKVIPAKDPNTGIKNNAMYNIAVIITAALIVLVNLLRKRKITIR